MAREQPGNAHRRGGTSPAERRTVMIGGIVVGLLGSGWFILSHVVMGTDTSDAIGEALGVVLALLVVLSVLGAVRSTRGHHG